MNSSIQNSSDKKSLRFKWAEPNKMSNGMYTIKLIIMSTEAI